MSDKRLLDKAWRVNNLYKIRDKNKQLIKFKRNRAQQHFHENKWFRNIILKSRQLGFTTDEAVDSLDDTLYTKNNECLLIANNLDASRAIFDKKIDFAWKNLHEELKKLYKVDANTSQALKFEFGDGSFSSITVDTTGRSGTYNRVHVTEFADICKKYPQKAQEILEGTIPAVPTNGRVDIESTSQGASGKFFEMCIEAMNRGNPILPVQFKFHFYNWTWDDEELAKTQVIDDLPEEFIAYQKLHKLTNVQIAYYYAKWLSLNKDWNALKREYPTTPEEAFEAIVEGTYYGVEVGIMERDGRVTVVPHDPGLKVHTVWDLGIGKNLVVGFYQKDRIALRKIDYWQGTGSDGLPEAIMAVKAKPYTYGQHIAPHDINSTDVGSGITRYESALKLGVEFITAPDVSVEDGINAAKLCLSTLWVDEEKCKPWITAIKNYRREWDDKRGMYKETPYHDWASHGADEFRYAAISVDFMTEEEHSSISVHIPEW